MEYRNLGRTGVKVSRLCFGTMSFGGDADGDESARMYAACRDAGINFFDTANAYSNGASEEILGGLIGSERDQLVITSKCFNNMNPDDVNAGGGNRRHVVQAVEASLRRLKTDRLDVLFLHMWDADTPVEESLRALEDLARAGKILYAGASNYAAWQVMKGLGIADRNGWARFAVLQPMYNLVKRQAEVEILPMVEAEGLGVISYSPLGGGLLSGKFGRNKRPDGGRLISNDMYTVRYSEDWFLDTAGAFTQFAADQGVHPATLAVAWVAAHPAITAPIIGARNLEQLQPSLAALDVDMSHDLRERISGLSRRPPLATDRLEEQGKGA